MRRQVAIRDARPDDVEDLIRLWLEAGNRREAVVGLAEEAPQALAHIAADPDERMLVSERDGRVVAALHMRRGPISPLHRDHVVHTSYLLVLPECRRQGHARALLDAAVSWAEEKDIAHILAVTASNSRDANRFLARLGLGTLATVRVAPTAALRKRLSAPTGGRGGRGSVGQVLAARRSMRRRTQPAPGRGELPT